MLWSPARALPWTYWGIYSALQIPYWFLHVFCMRKGLWPFTNSIWNTKMLVWQSDWKKFHRGELAEKGGRETWTVCRFKGAAWQKRGGFFWGRKKKVLLKTWVLKYHSKNWFGCISRRWEKMSQPQKYTFSEKGPNVEKHNIFVFYNCLSQCCS